jgi:uncharacterized protein (TIGR03086 family)
MDDGTPDAGAALLERALGYALCAVRPVTPRELNRPTPCGRWDLRALLWHTNDSLAALYEGIEDGYVGVEPASRVRVGDGEVRDGEVRDGEVRDGEDGDGEDGDVTGTRGRHLDEEPAPEPGPVPEPEPEPEPEPGGADDPAAAFRARASRLLGAWAAADCPAGRLVAVDGLPLPAAALARTGALEIAVHGWDIAQAMALPRPVPAALATQLMRTARQLVPRPAVRHPLFGPPLSVPAEADPSDRLVAFLGRDPNGGWRGQGHDAEGRGAQA